ncbi:PAS domain-containing protein [Actinoplanes sp. NPDC049118]|uniref:PAS domain-containing protein n=1 Tax=Actinoplanes sp. NPDC049118 TaxID=3155769 RepID=UPI0033CC5BD3
MPHYRQVLDSGKPLLNREVTGPCPAQPGRTGRWLASYYPVRTNGETVGVGVVIMDITARAEAEEFRSVVMDNMAEGLYTVDARGTLISMNRAAASMLGWSEDELRGEPIHSMVQFCGDGGPSRRFGSSSTSRIRGRSTALVMQVPRGADHPNISGIGRSAERFGGNLGVGGSAAHGRSVGHRAGGDGPLSSAPGRQPALPG